MKIIGKDGKEYFDVKSCLKADEAYDARIAAEKLEEENRKKALEAKIEQEKNAISKRKKELSTMIEKAEEKCILAENVYDEARRKANDVLKKAKEEANAILQAATKELESASAEKLKAIAAFNKEFGPYQSVVTGTKAVNNYNRLVRNMNRFWDSFWDI